MEREIIELIIATRYRIMFRCDSEIKENSYKAAFLKDITALFDSGKEDFVKAIHLFLVDQSDFLDEEQTNIKLECVNIYGKRRFRLIIYDICFALGIETELAVSLFLKDLNSICRSEDSRTIFDDAPFRSFISERIENNVDSKVKVMLQNKFSDESTIRTAAELELYIAINGDSKDVRSKKQLLDTLYRIGALQNEGLAFWCQESNDKEIKRTFSLLNKHFSNKYDTVYSELSELLTSKTAPSGQRLFNDDDFQKIEKLDEKLFELMDDNVEELIICKTFKTQLNK